MSAFATRKNKDLGVLVFINLIRIDSYLYL